MANIYQINFTDPATGTITLSPGTSNGPIAGAPLTGSEQSDLRLIGENVFLWGEAVNENFVRLLENFAIEEGATPGIPKTAADSEPGYGINNPVIGQTWYNKSDNLLYTYNGTTWDVVGADMSMFSKDHTVVLLQSYKYVDPNSGPFTHDDLRGYQEFFINVGSTFEFHQAPLDPFNQYSTIGVGNPATELVVPAGFKYARIKSSARTLVPDYLNVTTGSYNMSTAINIDGTPSFTPYHSSDKNWIGNVDFQVYAAGAIGSMNSHNDTGWMEVNEGDVFSLAIGHIALGTAIDYNLGTSVVHSYFTGNNFMMELAN